MENWYYLKNNRVVGPVAVIKLRELLIDSARKDQLLVKRLPLKQWYRLSELSRFNTKNSRFSTDLLEECSEIYQLYKSLEETETSNLQTKKYSTVNASEALERLKYNVQNELSRKCSVENKSTRLINDLSSFKESISSELQHLKTKISQNSINIEIPKMSSFSGRVRQILEG